MGWMAPSQMQSAVRPKRPPNKVAAVRADFSAAVSGRSES